MPKKGSRRISVDGTEYRWMIRRKPTYDQDIFEMPMTIAIEQTTDGSAGVLHVVLDVTRPDAMMLPDDVAITPSTVRSMILAALDAGWDKLNSFSSNYTMANGEGPRSGDRP